MKSSVLAFLALAPALGALGQDPTPVEAPIRAVTVYRQGASVTRVAELSPGGGAFLLRSLPADLDRAALRLNCRGGEVVGVELRERLESRLPEARLAELEGRIEALELRLYENGDGQRGVDLRRRYVEALFSVEEHSRAVRAAGAGAATADVEGPGREAWLAESLLALAAERRSLARERAELERELADARTALGSPDGGGDATVLDLFVEVADTSGAPAELAAEYLVPQASWWPSYELRARKDLSLVELAYRANVSQTTGEDWRDVELYLATTEPTRGAAGPRARAPRLSLSPMGAPDKVDRKSIARGILLEAEDDADDGEAAPLEARVEDLGLNLRYHLPRRESVESRRDTSSVLIGRAELAIEAEHVVVPALDPTVWLVGRARNTSPWVLLPGRANVYFGADFLGHAELPSVQPTEELTLHLGADRGVQVERIVLDEVTEKAGLFSSRRTLRQELRFKLKNVNGLTRDARGKLALVLQESIPRARDERIQVEIDRAEPDAAEGERWDALREERGIVSWVVSLARGEERVVELTTEISYPEDMELLRQ